MKMKQEILKRMTPYMKQKGFALSKSSYVRISNDVAQCIDFSVPTGIMYVTAYIIPLYVPCEGRYYTYGSRVQIPSLLTLTRDSDAVVIDKICDDLRQHFDRQIFPFFERVNSPEMIAQYIDQSCSTGISEFSCPPVCLERLKVFTYLYLGDVPKATKVISSYRKMLNENTFFTDSVKKKLLDEVASVELILSASQLELVNHCSEIIRDTRRYI